MNFGAPALRPPGQDRARRHAAPYGEQSGGEQDPVVPGVEPVWRPGRVPFVVAEHRDQDPPMTRGVAKRRLVGRRFDARVERGIREPVRVTPGGDQVPAGAVRRMTAMVASGAMLYEGATLRASSFVLTPSLSASSSGSHGIANLPHIARLLSVFRYFGSRIHPRHHHSPLRAQKREERRFHTFCVTVGIMRRTYRGGFPVCTAKGIP